jgi:hypothetical protein
MGQDKLFKRGEAADIPRLNQCFLCKAWQLESNLQAIEVQDQGGGYVQKLACQGCLGPILG